MTEYEIEATRDGLRWIADATEGATPLVVTATAITKDRREQAQATVAVHRGGVLVTRDRVTLSTAAGRRRFLEALASRNETLDERALLALDDAAHSYKPAGDVPAVLSAPRARLTGAQSVVDGVLVYALRYGESVVYATSAGEVLDQAQAAGRYALGPEPDLDARLSLDALERVRAGAPPPDGAALVEELRELLRTHIAWPAPHWPLVVALWIIGTYNFKLFTFFAYLVLNSATKRSGKSKLLEILAAATWNATPPQTTPTPATLYRDIHANSTTVLLDEMEHLRDGDQDARAVLAVLNVGFKYDAAVPRAEKNADGTFTVVRYRAFSPKALASIRPPADTIRDRALTVVMQRAKRTSPKLTRFDVRKLGPALQDLRDRLHLWALGNAAAVAELYSAADELPVPPELDDRARDIMEPLFAIAGAIDADAMTATLTPNLVDAAKAIAGARKADEQDDETVLVAAQALAEYLKHAGDGARAILTADTAATLLHDAGLSWVETSGQARSILRRLGFRSGQHWITGKNVRGYEIDKTTVEDLVGRYAPPAETTTVTAPADPPAPGGQEPARA